MCCLENKVFDWIETNGLFDGVSRVLLAVSGGADSVAMTHVLIKLKQQAHISCEFVIGHINHSLRAAESDADEQFVISLADSFGVPVVTKTVDVKASAKENKLSIETAGRNLRLKTLAEIAQFQKCDCIATAHHKDDLAETLIHRLMRGTGFRGLCGIWPVSYIDDAEFVRPMLGVRRSEIIQYCKDNSIRWREDVSNQNIDFTRNRLRHQLMPLLQAESGEIVNKLQQLSHQCRCFQLFTDKRAQSIVSKGQFDQTEGSFSIEQSQLKDAVRWVFYEVTREILVKMGIGLRDYSREHFTAIHRMAGQKKARADFPGQLEIVVQDGVVCFQTAAETPVFTQKSVTLEIDRPIHFGPWRICCKLYNRAEVDFDRFRRTKDAYVEWFDADKISGPLTVRARRNGDRFRPFGSKNEKKIARFLQDGQFDTKIRKNAFVVADGEKILWLAPVRMSEVVKITLKTRNILEIQFNSMH